MTTLILDANNLLYRTFWVDKTKNSDSKDISVLMFLRSLKSYCDKFNPDNIYACWDKKLKYPSTNFRKSSTGGTYKGNRDSSIAKEAHKNDKIIKELLDALGVKSMYPNVMEADDVIAYLCHNLPGKKFIITVDKDLFQLIDSETYVYSPIQKITVTPDNFTTYNKGVQLEYFLDYKALIGDKSDNIKGLDKVGHKRAINLINKFKSDKAFNILNEQQYETYKSNKEIMDLSLGYKFYDDEEVIYKEQFDTPGSSPDMTYFFKLCAEYGINSILKQKDKWETTFNCNNCLNNLISKLNT